MPDVISKADRLLIDEAIAQGRVVVCPPMRFGLEDNAVSMREQITADFNRSKAKSGKATAPATRSNNDYNHRRRAASHELQQQIIRHAEQGLLTRRETATLLGLKQNTFDYHLTAIRKRGIEVKFAHDPHGPKPKTKG